MHSDDIERKIIDAFREFEKKNWKSAFEICASTIGEQSDDYRIDFLRGLCYCESGNVDKGFAIIEETIRKNPFLRSFSYLEYGKPLGFGETKIDRYKIQLSLSVEHSRTESYLISYPKCGRTWLRLMLGCYALGTTKHDNPLELVEIRGASADFKRVHVRHDDDPHLKPVDKLFRDKRAYAGNRVLFLVRDPRDVIVSNFFQYTLRNDQQIAGDNFEGDLSAFIRHPIGGMRSLVEFYNIWAKNRAVPKMFHLAFYEDLLNDTKKTFLNCIEFLGWPKRSERLVDEIVHFSRFENMRKMEEAGAIKSFRLRTPKGSHPDAFKVRKGEAGGYRKYMSAQDIAFVDRYLEVNLDELYSRYKYRTQIERGAKGAKPSDGSVRGPARTDRSATSRPATFTRANPSPRYRELIAAFRELHEEGEKRMGVSPEETYSGKSLRRWLAQIRSLIQKVGARTLLDYGSGKGALYQISPLTLRNGQTFESLQDFWGLEWVQCYDPGYAPFSKRPTESFDVVICTSVLENCAEEDLPWILREIIDCARLSVFMSVACYPAHKTLPNGDNAHVTVRPPAWWRETIGTVFAARPDLVWSVWMDELDERGGRTAEWRGDSTAAGRR